MLYFDEAMGKKLEVVFISGDKVVGIVNSREGEFLELELIDLETKCFIGVNHIVYATILE